MPSLNFEVIAMPAPTAKYDTLIVPAPNTKMHDGSKYIPAQCVALKNGKIADIAPLILPSLADVTFQLNDTDILSPGLVDTHTHWAGYWGEGMNLDTHALKRGTVLAVDAGSNGPLNIQADLMPSVVNNSNLTGAALAFINIAPFGLKDEKAENYDLSLHSVSESIKVATAIGSKCVGVKIRLGWLQASSKDNIWKKALIMAAEVSTAIKKPLMLHIGHGPSIREILDVLDSQNFKQPIIVTHCFHGHTSGSILNYTKAEWDAMNARGVIWDLGNGEGSFARDTAMKGLQRGFKLMAISTDLHKRSLAVMARDMPHCISKVMSVGVGLEDALTMSTSLPARALGRSDTYGALEVGRQADLTILEHRKDSLPVIEFTDYQGCVWDHNEAVFPRVVFKNGEMITCA